VDSLVAGLVTEVAAGDHVVVMSNGGFGGFHDKLLAALQTREAP
jgi:UDP-N-acetylmuramate: L-alanyl-gamma-D-glutamyl-meso-diaminopimelate ligase